MIDLERLDEDVTVALAQVRSLEDWVTTATSADEAAQVADGARRLQQWLEIQKAAAALRIEATRLELVALRRVGQIGKSSLLTPRQRNAARFLAEITDDEFAQVLAGVTRPLSGLAIVQALRKASDQDARMDQLRAALQGRHCKPPGDDELAPRELADAVQTILERLGVGTEPFSVAEAADQVIELISKAVPGPWDDSDIRAAVRHAVREAMLHGDASGYAIPEFVTYHDGDLGWLRIPWEQATIDQNEMAIYRDVQARQVQRRADALAEVVTILEETSKRAHGSRDITHLTIAITDPENADLHERMKKVQAFLEDPTVPLRSMSPRLANRRLEDFLDVGDTIPEAIREYFTESSEARA